MKYFLHDTNAFNDEKVTELYIKFGYEGLGLFYTVLEKLAMQEKPVKTKVLKVQLKIGKRLDKIWKFMEEIDIISSNNGETFNKQLLNFSEKYKIKKESNRIRVANFRKKQEDVTRYSRVRNAGKVKLSKVKVFSEHSQELKLATLLKDLIKLNTPTMKDPNLQSWAKEIDLMFRIDKRTYEQIDFTIHWCQSDSFWRSNILSTKKLRKNFDVLVSKIKANQPLSI